MAKLEYHMNNPNMLNAHRVAEGWKQEITVRVLYDLIRPDGSAMKFRDMDDFAYGSLLMHFGCSDGGDGYIEFDDEDLRELSGPFWVDGSKIKDSHGIDVLVSAITDMP